MSDMVEVRNESGGWKTVTLCQHETVIYTVTNRVINFHETGELSGEASEIIKQTLPKTGTCENCKKRISLKDRGLVDYEIE